MRFFFDKNEKKNIFVLVLDQSASSQGPDDEGGDGQGDTDPDRSHHLVHEVGDLKQIQSAGEKQNFNF
jgi:hypothetical protein